MILLNWDIILLSSFSIAFFFLLRNKKIIHKKNVDKRVKFNDKTIVYLIENISNYNLWWNDDDYLDFRYNNLVSNISYDTNYNESNIAEEDNNILF